MTEKQVEFIEEAISLLQRGRWLGAATALYEAARLSGDAAKMAQASLAGCIREFAAFGGNADTKIEVLRTLEAWTIRDDRYFVLNEETNKVEVGISTKPNPFRHL